MDPAATFIFYNVSIAAHFFSVENKKQTYKVIDKILENRRRFNSTFFKLMNYAITVDSRI